MENIESDVLLETDEDIESEKIQLQDVELDPKRDLAYDMRVQFRLFRKRFSAYLRNKFNKDFTNILYVTAGKIPADYIKAFGKQYPDKLFKVLVPVTKLNRDLQKTQISFNFYLQNKQHSVTLYKFPKNRDNIEILGLYSTSWEDKNICDFQNLALYTKAVRICAKELAPKIIHSEAKIPFFLGAEFESKLRYPIKVIQFIDDFAEYEISRHEAFWALINIVDKKGMKRICRDKAIKKHIASLFNLHNTKRFSQLKDCLEFIYQNYSKFREQIDAKDNVEENILFSRLNLRAMQLFPQIAYCEENFYNPINYTLKKVDFWAITSKSQYEIINKNPELMGKISETIQKNLFKSSFVNTKCDIEQDLIYQNFTQENFRELRGFNKKHFLKEFSENRIKTNFIDRNLFKNENYVIKGYLDSFYDAPLLFASYKTEIFQEGIDIAFSAILKLFEEHKNIQVVINIPKGLQHPYIKAWVEFLEQNPAFAGRWVFVDAQINLAKFVASADLILLPRRVNSNDEKHFVAMKYGCIPVASNCGILNDTIVDIFDDITCGCGFKSDITFFTKDNVNDVYLNLLKKALNLFTQNPASWNLLVKNAISIDTGWDFETIEKYNTLYD